MVCMACIAQCLIHLYFRRGNISWERYLIFLVSDYVVLKLCLFQYFLIKFKPYMLPAYQMPLEIRRCKVKFEKTCSAMYWKQCISPHCRKDELYQVALQASNIEDLTEVIRESLTVMCKQWTDATHTFREKFDSLSTLIVDNGNFRL